MRSAASRALALLPRAAAVAALLAAFALTLATPALAAHFRKGEVAGRKRGPCCGRGRRPRDWPHRGGYIRAVPQKSIGLSLL